MAFMVVIDGDEERIVERLCALLNDNPAEISGFMVFPSAEESLKGMITFMPSLTNSDMCLVIRESDVARRNVAMAVGSRVLSIHKDLADFMALALPALPCTESELLVTDYHHAEDEKREIRNRQWKENMRHASRKIILNVNKKW